MQQELRHWSQQHIHTSESGECHRGLAPVIRHGNCATLWFKRTHTHTGYTAHSTGKKIKTASSTGWLLTTVAMARQWWKASVCVSEREMLMWLPTVPSQHSKGCLCHCSRSEPFKLVPPNFYFLFKKNLKNWVTCQGKQLRAHTATGVLSLTNHDYFPLSALRVACCFSTGFHTNFSLLLTSEFVLHQNFQ